MKTRWLVLTVLSVLLSLLTSTGIFAALQYELRQGLTLNWYLENTDPAWPSGYEAGYFHDFNGDGLPDYLFHQSNGTSQDRIFCIDTSNSDSPKTFDDDRTALRIIDWQPDIFIPADIYLEKEINQQRTPDIIVFGKDVQSGFSKFLFRRLDETNNAFPDETSWSIDVEDEYNPTLIWSDYDFNGDNYPDFFIYNSLPNQAGQFYIGCFNGTNGGVLWERNVNKAGEDLGGFLGPSNLVIQVLPISPEMNLTGDFDNDGKPEILLFYTFSYLTQQFDFGKIGNVVVLKGANGENLTPQYPGWWQVFDYDGIIVPSGSAMYDHNKDTFVDFELYALFGLTEDVPVLRVIDLKNKVDLFQTNNADFGPDPEDATGFFSMPARRTDAMALADVNGDTCWDLAFTRVTGFSQGDTDMNTGYGVFNAYADEAAQRGRKIWLANGAPYDYAQYAANDWNGDNIFDYALVQNPTGPMGGSIQWNYKLQNVGAAGATPHKTFNTTLSYTGSYSSDSDQFKGWTFGLGPLGDVDEDGQLDTSASHACDFDYGDDGTTDLSIARILVFDNTPGSDAPDMTADFLATLSNEDQSIGSFLTFAHDPWKEEFVDQNDDGKQNDVIITVSDRAIFAVSFSHGPSIQIKSGDINGDDAITIADSILASQVSAGIQPEGATIYIQADINGDGKISAEEFLFVLQVIAGLKSAEAP
jgi:hypothetical protein